MSAREGGAAIDIADAPTFHCWWQRRDLPHDRCVLRAAMEAGYVTRSGGLLWLTAAGRKLHDEGRRLARAAIAARAPQSGDRE